jgi:hypothetical protein
MFGTETNKIRAMFVFEIMGRPADYIKETMSKVIDTLSQYKGVSIVKKVVHEPKPFEKQEIKGFFTTFGEAEILADNLEAIFNIVLNSLPAHVEIIEPEELRLDNFSLNYTLNFLTSKLHQYDEVAKGSMMERDGMLNKIKEMEAKLSELGYKPEPKGMLAEIPEAQKEKEEETKKDSKKKDRKKKKR